MALMLSLTMASPSSRSALRVFTDICRLLLRESSIWKMVASIERKLVERRPSPSSIMLMA